MSIENLCTTFVYAILKTPPGALGCVHSRLLVQQGTRCL